MLLRIDKSRMFMDCHLIHPHPNLSVSLSNLYFLPSHKIVLTLKNSHHLLKNIFHKFGYCNIKSST